MKLNDINIATSPSLPRQVTRWQQLVTARWLVGLISGESIVAAPSGDWRLFEVGCGVAEQFLRGHILGAGYIDTDRLEQGPFWNKVADHELLQLLLDNGIRHDTSVVLYGRNNLAAARAAHLMLYAGVKDVRLLDGGFAAWKAMALPLVQGEPIQHPAARDFGVDFPAHPEYLIEKHQATALLQQHDGALVSIRTWNEFIGNTSG